MKFDRQLKEIGIELTELQKEQFQQYYDLLIEWNKVMNLTGITEYEEVNEKHFLDSLALVKAFDPEKATRLIDVGTGAGFPGIPLKIVFPELEVVLLDSLNKRVKFLQEVISTLGLTKIEVIHGRAEDYAKNVDYREKFDLCVSRAVANLSTLSEYCLPYVRVNGFFISFINRLIYRFCIAKTIHQNDTFCFFYFLFGFVFFLTNRIPPYSKYHCPIFAYFLYICF